uniref:Uncharacterized protein n=1 Tax=Amphora coffeiformis TaxID=265554 RepID=A0A7S3P1L5_9STRA
MGEKSDFVKTASAKKKSEEKAKKTKTKKVDEKVKKDKKKHSSSSAHKPRKSSRSSSKNKKDEEIKTTEVVVKCTDPTQQRKKLRLLAKMMKGGRSTSTATEKDEKIQRCEESLEFQLPHQHSVRSLEERAQSNLSNRPKHRRASLDMTKGPDHRIKNSDSASLSDSNSTITTEDMDGTFHSCISKYSHSSNDYSSKYSSNDDDDDDDDCSVSSSVSEASFGSAGGSSVSSVQSTRSICLGRKNVASIPIHVATTWDTVKQKEGYASDLTESLLCEMMRLGPSERNVRREVLGSTNIKSFRSSEFDKLARKIADSIDYLVNLLASPDMDDCDVLSIADELRGLGIQQLQLFCSALTFALEELLKGEDEFPEDARNAWDQAFESFGAKMTEGA